MYFKKIRSTYIFPDRVTFVSLSSTCAHLGMAKDEEDVISNDEGLIQNNYNSGTLRLYGESVWKNGLIGEAYEVEFEPGSTALCLLPSRKCEC